MAVRFRDRREAGIALARALGHLAGRDDNLVLGLPRGGVPVAAEVAAALGAPLDVFVVRKVGVPGQEELAMGAIASGGIRVINEPVVRQLGIGEAAFMAAARAEMDELVRREAAYRGDRPPLDPRGRNVIIVDDGIATGSTMLAAVEGIRQRGPEAITVASPVAARDVAARLRQVADEVVCVNELHDMDGVSLWYDDFRQTPDSEVRSILDAAGRAGAGPGGTTTPSPETE